MNIYKLMIVVGTLGIIVSICFAIKIAWNGKYYNGTGIDDD